MEQDTDRPPADSGLFRSWWRMYAAVLLTLALACLLLFWFSRTFGP